MSKARTAAFNAVRFAVRLQILAKRLRTQKETLFEPDLEAALLDAENDEAIGSVRGSSPTFNLTSPGLGMPFERQSVPRSEMREGINCARVSLLAEAADKIPRNVFLSDLSAIGTLIYASWASVLLVCCPLGIISALCGWGATPTFFLNFLILIPLAMTLGDVTEDLALRMGDVAGGLLNASFGNVTELVLGVAALRNGLLEVVADSLLGSILSNMLLVLGCCFLVGGLIHHQQTFNATSNRTCGSLLFLSSIGIAIPTAAASMIDHPTRPDWILQISRGTAVVLLLCYVAYLIFQLGTHKHLFDESEEELLGTSDDEEPELPVISAVGGVCAMGVISVLVAVHSEFLTRSIEKTATETGISMSFLAVIVLPIAGNACEHITAVMVAARNKMDLSLGIALGSSLQIALFAIPFMVIVGWAIGQPMSLDYDYFSVLALVLSVIQANFVNADATSHWLMGVQLCAVYFLIALVFWFR